MNTDHYRRGLIERGRQIAATERYSVEYATSLCIEFLKQNFKEWTFMKEYPNLLHERWLIEITGAVDISDIERLFKQIVYDYVPAAFKIDIVVQTVKWEK